MRTAVVSLYHQNYQSLHDLVLPNWREYTARHGYGLYVHCGEMGPGAIGFQKMRYVYDLMFVRREVDLALVVDLDLIFTNLTRRVEEFTDFSADYFVTKDTNGINNGSFIIRASAASHWLLSHMIEAHKTLTNEQDVLKINEPGLLQQRLITIVPHPAFNSLEYALYPEWGDPSVIPGQWQCGHFILHMPGCSLAQRLEMLGSAEIQGAIVR